MTELAYRRVLVKVSGEALMGERASGFDPPLIARLSAELAGLVALGAQVALVAGAGNIVRGAELAALGVDRVAADHMGMLGTLINALMLQDAISQRGVEARVLSALPITGVCEPYVRATALRYLEDGCVVAFAGGTGNPLFTTDTAASLRAVEIGADLLIKATKVDGVYSADPVRDPAARFYPHLSYADALVQRLRIMDETAMVLCRDHRLALRVVNIFREGALERVLRGEAIGSLISEGEGYG